MLPPHYRKNYLYLTKKIFIACIWYITEKYTGTRYGTMHHRKNYLHITGTFFITWLWYTVHHRKIYLVVGSCQSVRYHASQKYLLRHYRIFFTTCVGTVHRYPVRYHASQKELLAHTGKIFITWPVYIAEKIFPVVGTIHTAPVHHRRITYRSRKKY